MYKCRPISKKGGKKKYGSWKEGCEEVRKEGGKEGNNTHGAWKEGGELK